MQGWADSVSFNQKTVTVEESVVDNRGGGLQSGPDPYRHGSLTDMKNEKFGKRREGKRFEVGYDKLVVAVGCYSQTFGTKGVNENAYFMKDVGDARRIRKRVLECFEMASLPTTSPQLRERLLNFAIIGGGPTGMEFAAELSDLIQVDLSHIYPRLVPLARIAVHDVAPKVLSMFDEKLTQYAMKNFNRAGIKIKTKSHIEELRRGVPKTNGSVSDEEVADAQGCYTLTTREEGEQGIGMCVWATGNKMNPFVKSALRKTRRFPVRSALLSPGAQSPTELPTQDWMLEKDARTGAIVVDDRLHARMVSQTTTPAPNPDEDEQPASRAVLADVYALGDVSCLASGPVPATAQVADQQARYLAKVFNALPPLPPPSPYPTPHASPSGTSTVQPTTTTNLASYAAFPVAVSTSPSQAVSPLIAVPPSQQVPPFKFKNAGIMAYVGNSKAIFNPPNKEAPDISGRAAWLIWRGAYMAKSISWRNRILIPTYW